MSPARDPALEFVPGGDRTPLGRAPTPEEVAKKALAPFWFEWFEQRDRAEALVAAAIREDRARIRAVVNRARVLLPALLRDLTIECGGRE